MEVMNMRIYVDVNAVRNGNGTEQTPFRKSMMLQRSHNRVMRF